MELRNFQLESIDFLIGLSELKELVIIENSENTDYSAITELKKLNTLKIIGTSQEPAYANIDSFGTVNSFSVEYADIANLYFNTENHIEKIEVVCSKMNLDYDIMLDNLICLKLEGFKIDDISKLLNSNIKEIYLENIITDYDALNGLNEVEELFILGKYNNCTDFGFLKSMNRLKTLRVDSSVEDLDLMPYDSDGTTVHIELSDLVNLEELFINAEFAKDGTDFIDTESIAKLQKLRKLYLMGFSQKDFSSINQLNNLENLYFTWCFINELPDLSNLTKLESLIILDNDEVIDMQNLSTAENLRALFLMGTYISGVEKMDELNSLEIAVLTDTNSEDIIKKMDLGKLRCAYFEQ